MSAICNCKYPKPKQLKAMRADQKFPDLICDRCQQWYDPRHGSKPEAVAGALMIPRGRPGTGKFRHPKPTRRIVA